MCSGWGDLLNLSGPLRIVPGQTRPIAFSLVTQDLTPRSVGVVISWRTGFSPDWKLADVRFEISLVARTIHEPHRITFRRPGGIVSYAILITPRESAHEGDAELEKVPLLINLHGAGVEADSEQVRHMLDDVGPLSAWTLYPAGVTSWSGDDWRM